MTREEAFLGVWHQTGQPGAGVEEGAWGPVQGPSLGMHAFGHVNNLSGHALSGASGPLYP